MSRNVAEVTGKMPFSGKHIVKYWYQKGREASRKGEYIGKIASATALGVFAVLHAVQLKMGISELAHDGGQNPALAGVDALYTVANAMATYTQAYLAAKVVATAKEPAIVTPEGMTFDGFDQDNNRPNIELGPPSLMELIVTAGGQAVFLATMH